METVDLKYKSSDGKHYYNVVIDKQEGTFFMVKDASCTASVHSYLYKRMKKKLNQPQLWDRFCICFNGTNPEPNRDKIYKKYHKIVFGTKSK